MDEIFIRNRIGQLVADSGKSEKSISKDLGRSPGYIQSLTSGKSMPSIPMLIEICNYFGIEIKDFFDPNIRHPLIVQRIFTYTRQMDDEDLATLERISQRLSEK